MDLHEDLRARWRATDKQMAEAAEVQREVAGVEVYTGQLLIGKDYGIWTEDVEVKGVAGVFFDRETVARHLEVHAKHMHAATGLPVSGSYSVHFTDGGTAVFEDILVAKAGHAIGSDRG